MNDAHDGNGFKGEETQMNRSAAIMPKFEIPEDDETGWTRIKQNSMFSNVTGIDFSFAYVQGDYDNAVDWLSFQYCHHDRLIRGAKVYTFLQFDTLLRATAKARNMIADDYMGAEFESKMPAEMRMELREYFDCNLNAPLPCYVVTDIDLEEMRLSEVRLRFDTERAPLQGDDEGR